MDSATEWSYDA